MEWYHYSYDDLKKGVLCSVCGLCCAKTSQRMFFCGSCNLPVEDGYARALADWFDFVGPDISNAQCRAFLGLKDAHAVRYVMNKSGLVLRGHARGGRYSRV